LTARDLGVPETFNATTYFVDRNVAEGRGDCIAIECGDERLTYAAVLANVNRTGHALRDTCGVSREERVLLLLLDGPAFVYAFFRAIKIGAVPIPLNTLWKPADYEYVIRDSGAAVVIISAELLPTFDRVSETVRRSLRHVIVVGGDAPAGTERFGDFVAGAADDLEAVPTSRDAPAFW